MEEKWPEEKVKRKAPEKNRWYSKVESKERESERRETKLDK